MEMLDRGSSKQVDPDASSSRERAPELASQLRSRIRRRYLDEAEAAIKSLGSKANYLIPLGILGPFSQWLQFPDWMRENTALEGSGALPQSLTLGDDITIVANMLERGCGPYLLESSISSDRLITGPNVSLIVRNAPTLGGAMEKMAVALSATNPNIHATFQVCGNTAQFDVNRKVPPGRLIAFLAAMRILLALRAIERFLFSRAREARLQLTLPKDFLADHIWHQMAERIDFSKEVDRITFPASWAELPNSDQDPLLWKIAVNRVRAMERKSTDRDLASYLRHRVSEVLAAENRVPRLKELAAELEMTDRTIGRKLSALGIHFQDIVNQERRSLIEQHVSDPSVSLSMIASLSGFSSLSSFSRSFRAWFGVSASRFRRLTSV